MSNAYLAARAEAGVCAALDLGQWHKASAHRTHEEKADDGGEDEGGAAGGGLAEG